jgi:hypothetical protein
MTSCDGIVDPCQWIYEEFRVVVAKQMLSRELRAMGYRKLSARPRHRGSDIDRNAPKKKKERERNWTSRCR